MFKTGLFFDEISDNEFYLLRDVIFKESGINLTERKKALLHSRLIKRLKALNIDNYKVYYEYLNKNYHEEIINLINCITTNKTDFFRESKHFKFLREVILPKFEKRNPGKFRIWSAGCSTGEEPYSIAITIAEYFRNKRMPDVKILATDIDTDVLGKAVAGIYKEEDLEEVDPAILRIYFQKGKKENSGLFTVRESIKNMVSFGRLNLLSESYPMNGLFDIIFCRNVIIYFDKKTKDDVINKFYDYLTDDGYFFAGHSETLANSAGRYFLIGNTIYGKAVKCT
ncbi:MAG: protein-glutamate O-methyltransferase CheR [Spirochaetes bacterium]|nr:protein-glutamate O-methyltransferase CheR [Spirochaetota bacterium]